MYLNASTDKIEIVLGGTVATNQLQWNVSYQDITSSGMTLPQSGGAGLTNNATAVDIVAAPAALTTRQVTQINVYNADTATATVTIQKDVSGTNYVLMRIALTTLDVLMWSREDGWRVMSATGGGTTYTFSTGLTNTSGTVTANLSTGVAGGQSVVGGTAASNSLTLSSTTNATKGKLLFGTSAYDEVNNRLGIGTQSPSAPVDVWNNSTVNPQYRLSDSRITIPDYSSVGFSPALTTNTTGFINLQSATTGGNQYGGFTTAVNNGNPLIFNGYHGGTAPTTPGILFQGWKHNGTTNRTGLVNSEIIAAFRPGGGTDVMQVLANANVLINTTTDAGFRLDVNGTARVQGNLTVTAGTLAAGATVTAMGLTATMPSVTTANQNGVLIDITSAGSSSFTQFACRINLNAGYTGSSITSALTTLNLAAGTGTGLLSLGANLGFTTNAVGVTTGYNIGTRGNADNGNLNAGILGLAVTAKNSATNIGVIGFGRNTGTSPTQIGGYFGLHSADPTFVSGALVCDNGSTTSDIFVARDNGTIAWSIQDGGHTAWADAENMVFGTTTGTKIATGNTQKLGFWNAAPIAQPTTAVAAATRVGGGGTTLTDTDTFDGYTLAQVVKALRNAGLLA